MTEIETLKAQLAQALEENRELRDELNEEHEARCRIKKSLEYTRAFMGDKLSKLRAENQQQAGVILALRDAANCINHWHDTLYNPITNETEGMVVSAEHVRKLWEVLANTTEAAQKAREVVWNEAVEACAEAAQCELDSFGDVVAGIQELKTQEGK